jgi:hypothetical protein
VRNRLRLYAGWPDVETPALKFKRVLSALEDLVTQEALLLRAEDFAAVEALQNRTAPLVEFLAANPTAANEALRDRVGTVAARRSENDGELTRQMARVREELSLNQANRGRISQIMPAYRQPAGELLAGQLSARG